MQPLNAAGRAYEVERRACHAARPGFRIAEMQIGPTQTIPCLAAGTDNHDRACSLPHSRKIKKGALGYFDCANGPGGQARREYGFRARA